MVELKEDACACLLANQIVCVAQVHRIEEMFLEFHPLYHQAISDPMGLDECQTNPKMNAANPASSAIEDFVRIDRLILY